MMNNESKDTSSILKMNIDTLDGYIYSLKKLLEKTCKVHVEFAEGTPEKIKNLMHLNETVYKEVYDELAPLYEIYYQNKKSTKRTEDEIYQYMRKAIKYILKNLFLKEIAILVTLRMPDKSACVINIRRNLFAMNSRLKTALLLDMYHLAIKKEAKAQEKLDKMLKKANFEELDEIIDQTIAFLEAWMERLIYTNKETHSLVITNICMTLKNAIEFLNLFHKQ